MKRVIVLLMDSFGIGATADAPPADKGANTLGHIAEWTAKGRCDTPSRQGPLSIPNLSRLGLAKATLASAGGMALPGLDLGIQPEALYGYACEKSLGKDTPSGHWEIAGVPVDFEWGYFPPTYPSFPPALVEAFIQEGQLIGILGNRHASGTVIIDELGEEHIKTGQPIIYTSGDSVFQIAAHETYFGLEKLYALCEIARKLVDPYNIGRVIARPFLGEPGRFYRTGHRKDYAVSPPKPTLLNYLVESGRSVIAIGKTADIFAHSGISKEIKAEGNMALFDATLKAMIDYPDAGLIFTNFVDFDMNFGHRRDVAGYAQALEAFDQRLPELMMALQPEDWVVITADHGCDPTYPGSDHTREHIPVLLFGPQVPSGFLGERTSFADIGQSIAQYLDVGPLSAGEPFFLSEKGFLTQF